MLPYIAMKTGVKLIEKQSAKEETVEGAKPEELQKDENEHDVLKRLNRNQ